jgi:thiopeptide-type bacteriocin biosynthesis protein
VPDRVVLGQDDRRLPLDLAVPAHRHVLLDTLRDRDRVVLTEAPAPDAFDWIGGRAHELVLPLAATATPAHPLRPRSTAGVTVAGSAADDVSVPGTGSWLDARLAVHHDRQHTVLADHLPVLLDALAAGLGGGPDWWFVRLTEPEPHLRLRVRLPHPRTFGAAAARVGGWADHLRQVGLAGDLRFATYRPETGRYGHSAALTAAEAVFAADSAAALAQLRLPDRSDDPAVTAASMLDLVTAFTGRDRGLHWLLDHAPRTASTSPARDIRARVLALTAPTGRAALAGVPGGDLAVAAWARRSAALAGYRAALGASGVPDPNLVLPDLLHLHHARVAGPGLDAERASLHLARAAALSHLTRAGWMRGTA